jgi:hypothetical protein
LRRNRQRGASASGDSKEIATIDHALKGHGVEKGLKKGVKGDVKSSGKNGVKNAVA